MNKVKHWQSVVRVIVWFEKKNRLDYFLGQQESRPHSATSACVCFLGINTLTLLQQRCVHLPIVYRYISKVHWTVCAAQCIIEWFVLKGGECKFKDELIEKVLRTCDFSKIQNSTLRKTTFKKHAHARAHAHKVPVCLMIEDVHPNLNPP
jgi:hypothetical protein